MPTLNYLTGFEWPGVTTISATGGGLVTGVGGTTPTVSASAARTGSYGMRCNCAAGSSNITTTVTAGLAAGRFYIYMVSLPSAATFPNIAHLGAGANPSRIFITDTGSIRAVVTGGSTVIGPTLSTGTWYRIDFAFDTTGTTHTADLWVDGEYVGQATGASSADTDTTLAIGIFSTTTTFECYIDDLIVSSTLADAPFGEGMVLAYVPSGAAEHQSITAAEWATTSDFSSFADFTGATESVSAPLIDDLTAGTDGIRADGGAGGQAGNARWATALLSGTNPGTPPQAVRGIAVHQDASSGTNNITERIELSGSTSNIFSGNPAAAWEYKAAIFTTNPASSAWTNANLSSLKIEVDSTDSAPNVWIGGILLEVAFPTGQPTLVTARRI